MLFGGYSEQRQVASHRPSLALTPSERAGSYCMLVGVVTVGLPYGRRLAVHGNASPITACLRGHLGDMRLLWVTHLMNILVGDVI